MNIPLTCFRKKRSMIVVLRTLLKTDNLSERSINVTAAFVHSLQRTLPERFENVSFSFLFLMREIQRIPYESVCSYYMLICVQM